MSTKSCSSLLWQLQRIPPAVTTFQLGINFPAKQQTFGVEPRGFEPLTSAVQRRIYNVVVVHCCSKTSANKHILLWVLSPVFAVVRPGWCQIGVNWCRYICASADALMAHAFL